MTEVFEKDTHYDILRVKPWLDRYPNVIAGFTTREGGVSKTPYHSNNLGLHVEDNEKDVLKNRQHLAAQVNMPLDHWVMADQVHSNHVEVIKSHHVGSGSISTENAIRQTDGLFTSIPNILCTAMFADCVPLYFLDHTKGMIAISHAGWKGTVAKIAQNTIQTFRENGSFVEDIEVVIGPSICQSCYQVDEYVISKVDTNYSACYTGTKGSFQLNLKQLNYELIKKMGVPTKNIHMSNYCTSHHSLFFSHRRDQHPTGRMLGFIALT